MIPKRVAFSWLVKGHSDSPHGSCPLGLEPVGVVEVFFRNRAWLAKDASGQSAALESAPDCFVVVELPGEGLRVGADAYHPTCVVGHVLERVVWFHNGVFFYPVQRSNDI